MIRGRSWLLGVIAMASLGATVGCSSCPTVGERPPLDQLSQISDQAIDSFVASLNERYAQGGETVNSIRPMVLIAGTSAAGDAELGAAKANLDLELAGQFSRRGFVVLSQDITDQLLTDNSMSWTQMANASKFEQFKSVLRNNGHEAEEYLLCKSKMTGVHDRQGAGGPIQRTTVSLYITLSDPSDLKMINQDAGGELIWECETGAWRLRE